MGTAADVDFAYKYPFSNEAKSLIKELSLNRVAEGEIISAEVHLSTALADGLVYKNTGVRDAKVGYVVTYTYCRMLVSALMDANVIRRYTLAEAQRSAQALVGSDTAELNRLAAELGLKIRADGFIFTIDVYSYLNIASQVKGLELANQMLNNGTVMLQKTSALRLFQGIMRSKILEGLPISKAELPDAILDYAKGSKIRLPINVSDLTAVKPKSGTSAWIDRLLQTPIPDIRHRTVNLILAPYLVNTKGMSPEQAADLINEYIERCKQLDPGTKINYRYIRYQCEYAKRRGLRPLSLTRAKDLLSGAVDVNTLLQ